MLILESEVTNELCYTGTYSEFKSLKIELEKLIRAAMKREKIKRGQAAEKKMDKWINENSSADSKIPLAEKKEKSIQMAADFSTKFERYYIATQKKLREFLDFNESASNHLEMEDVKIWSFIVDLALKQHKFELKCNSANASKLVTSGQSLLQVLEKLNHGLDFAQTHQERVAIHG